MINILCRRKRNKYPTWGVRPQGWNSKELTGARTSGGVCGLIRRNAKNLTKTWHWLKGLEIGPWTSVHKKTGGAWLSSARVVRCWVKSRNERNPYTMLPAFRMGTHSRLPRTTRRKAGMTSSHHAPYVLGYTRTTMGWTEGSEAARWSKTQKSSLSSDWRLKFAFMKPELLVMAGQHTAVNTFPGLVHTARHTMRVGNTRSLWANF